MKIIVIINGKIPTQEDIDALQNYFDICKNRPLTDHVIVSAPTPVSYNLNVVYHIDESDKNIATEIQQKVDSAIEGYITWQDEKIGRDINPSYLVKEIIDAGAKRCEINEPSYTNVSNINIATLNTKTIVYGGIE